MLEADLENHVLTECTGTSLSSARIHANMANSCCARTASHTSSVLLNRRVSLDVTQCAEISLSERLVGPRAQFKRDLLLSACRNICFMRPGMGRVR